MSTSTKGPVSLRDVTVEFPDPEGGAPRRVLDGITLECSPGELVVLVGRSGCGKTTLLNAVAGLVPITSGSIEVLGTTPIKARTKSGYMFARDALMPWRRTVRNVELQLELQRVPKAERRERAMKMLDRVGLKASAHQFPWQLSQGMRQRAALARTWVTEPPLLLMDEPFAALDAQTKITVRAEFLQTWEERKPTTLFVTHDLAEALLIGDRIIMLGHGKIEMDVRVPFAHPRDVEELSISAEFRELERDMWQRLK